MVYGLGCTCCSVLFAADANHILRVLGRQPTGSHHLPSPLLIAWPHPAPPHILLSWRAHEDGKKGQVLLAKVTPSSLTSGKGRNKVCVFDQASGGACQGRTRTLVRTVSTKSQRNPQGITLRLHKGKLKIGSFTH